MYKLFSIILGVSTVMATTTKGSPDTGRPFPDVERLSQAIFKAEGGNRAKKPFGVLSIRVKDKLHAKKICQATIRNNYKRWVKAGRKGDFINFLASKYAPVGVANDPSNLNVHWAKNVRFWYNKLLTQSKKNV